MKLKKILLIAVVLLITLDIYYVTRPLPLIAKGLPGVGSIVRLVDSNRTFCSGTVVNDNTIVTAGHCVIEETPLGLALKSTPIEIRAFDNVPRKTFGKVRALSVQMDSAILKGNFQVYEPRDIISDVKTLNEKRDTKAIYVACGYPLDGKLYCTGVHYKNLNDFMWSVDGLLLPGMSGGPVLDENGAVIAINHAVEREHSIVSPTYNIDKEF